MSLLQEDNKRLLLKHERKTPAFLTLYEKAQLLGARASDLQKPPEHRAVPIQLTKEELDALPCKGPLEIAEAEFSKGKLRMWVRRVHVDGTYELWDLAELKFVKI
jgi:hypothetical protein